MSSMHKVLGFMPSTTEKKKEEEEEREEEKEKATPKIGHNCETHRDGTTHNPSTWEAEARS